jgi:hypothetical protein
MTFTEDGTARKIVPLWQPDLPVQYIEDEPVFMFGRPSISTEILARQAGFPQRFSPNRHPEIFKKYRAPSDPEIRSSLLQYDMIKDATKQLQAIEDSQKEKLASAKKDLMEALFRKNNPGGEAMGRKKKGNIRANRENKRRIPNAELSPTQLNSVLGLPPDTRWMSLDTNLRGRRWKQILPSNEMINVYPYYFAYFSGEPYGNSQLYPPSETRSSSAYHFIPGLHIAELIETASGQAPPTPSRLPREYAPIGFSAAKLAKHPTIRNLQVPFVQFMDSTLQDAGGQIPDFFALEPYNQAIQQILYGRMLEMERENKPDDDLARVRTAMYHRDIPALGRLLYDRSR